MKSSRSELAAESVRQDARPLPESAERASAPRRPESRAGRSPVGGRLPDEVVLEVGAAPDSSLAIRVVNFIAAALALVILGPLMLVVAIAIKLDSGGPVLYRQLRIGVDRRSLGDVERAGDTSDIRRTMDLGGRPFLMYKFRTMRLDAESETGPVWASPEDFRTTRLGRFLRRYRLDELPQFWNVLRGDMSVVGPRPERPTFVHLLRQEFEEYPLRQRVPPGITGWAQVNQEPDRTLDDVRAKLRYDLEYLRDRSLTFDLRIMLRTLPVMLESDRAER